MSISVHKCSNSIVASMLQHRTRDLVTNVTHSNMVLLSASPSKELASNTARAQHDLSTDVMVRARTVGAHVPPHHTVVMGQPARLGTNTSMMLS